MDYLPDASFFTFIDSCAGGGRPTPIMEPILDQKLRAQGRGPVRFVLTDLYPPISDWKGIAKRSKNISYIKESVDAPKAPKIS